MDDFIQIDNNTAQKQTFLLLGILESFIVDSKL